MFLASFTHRFVPRFFRGSLTRDSPPSPPPGTYRRRDVIRSAVHSALPHGGPHEKWASLRVVQLAEANDAAFCCVQRRRCTLVKGKIVISFRVFVCLLCVALLGALSARRLLMLELFVVQLSVFSGEPWTWTLASFLRRRFLMLTRRRKN